jgi:hypothetical protein
MVGRACFYGAQAIKSEKIAFYACALKLWQSYNLTAQAIKSDKIAFYACALKFWLCKNLTVVNSIGKT